MGIPRQREGQREDREIMRGAVVVGLGVCVGEHIPGYETTYEVVKTGHTDDIVGKGSVVTVHATGTVVETGKQFWSTKDAGQQPFTYNAGVGGVIKGWDQGCLGMKVGEVRKLMIPAEEGYG